MRKLLLFFTFVLTALGVKAATISGDGISGATDNSSGKKVQTLVVSTPGALAAWVAAHTGDNYDTNNPFGGLGGSDDFYSLNISGELNAADLAALNSSTCAAFSRFPRIDMSAVTLAADATSADVCGVNFGTGSFDKNGTTVPGAGAEYILLPNGTTEADDVTLMSSMKESGKNSNLKMVGSYDDTNSSLPELALYSFKTNEVLNFNAAFTSMNISDAMIVRMAGSYGETDLVNGTSLNFNSIAPIWDFTGADFAPYTIPSYGLDANGYNETMDFYEDNPKVTSLTNYPSNAFYFFGYYSKKVVDITLPTEITTLPPYSLQYLGTENKDGYKLIHNMSDADFTNEFGEYYTIPELVIPDNIATVDWECALRSKIQRISFGTGLKTVNGGAFANSVTLQELDFKAGLSGCRLGSAVFQECNNMKHIVLTEGIISMGSYCFDNSQNLESIRLPETLTDIGNYSFQNGHALSSITIPASVKKIGMGAFSLTAISDVYLMAEKPEDVPIIYTAGSDWGDGKSTFNRNTMESNNTLVWDGNGNFNGKADKKIKEMTFDEAAAAYFANCNRMAALHFSPNVASVVLSEISSHYGLTSTDGYGIPIMSSGDSEKRATAMGLADMGGTGANGGIFTQYGWAQFLIMKELSIDNPEVYTKEYDDVWNTMCFPFDLTDEQLAVAFNEGYNIVDFSGVEIQQPEENKDEKLTLILHFNTVAKTIYKDAEGNVYTPIGREKDGSFEYNIYQRDGKTYKHVQVGTSGGSYKTKTFAENGSSNNPIVEIDGILATAGHPYMVHPNTGTNSGMPMTRCHFSGITWKPEDDWEDIYNDEARTVDLGVSMGNQETGEPDVNNFFQAAYSKYNGQTYTFKGNPVKYSASAATANPEPSIPADPGEYVAPTDPDGTDSPFTAEDKIEPSETLPAPEGLTTNEQNIYGIIGDQWFWGNYDEITCSYNDNSEQWSTYNSNTYKINGKFGLDPYNDAVNCFNTCKNIFNKAKNYVTLYDAYVANQAQWERYNAYLAAVEAYNNQTAHHDAWQALKDAYDEAVLAHEAWEEEMVSYQTLIPTGAYFLGRQGRGWPKYYREIADDTRSGATGGFWTQFTAVIIPDAAAKAGIEAEIDGTGSQGVNQSVEMVFDEGFLGEEKTSTEIEQIITEAEAEGQKVEYMQVVYNINGQIVREGTELTGLPKGIYIVNGKKYFVR